MLIVVGGIKSKKTRQGNGMYTISGGWIYANVFESTVAYEACRDLYENSMHDGNGWHRPHRIVLAEILVRKDSMGNIWNVVNELIAIDGERLWRWSKDDYLFARRAADTSKGDGDAN